MDLFGSKRRNKDLMLLEKSRHDLLSSSGRVICSCGWQGADASGQSVAAIESYFVGHIRASRPSRGW